METIRLDRMVKAGSAVKLVTRRRVERSPVNPGPAAPVADWPAKRRWTREAFDTLAAAGYSMNSGVTAVRDDSRATFVYRGALWHGAGMLGLGVSAFGHVQGTHYQNDKRIERYVERVDAGELALQRGYVMTDDQRLEREIVLGFKAGRVDRADLRRRRGLDPWPRFRDELDALAEAGLAEVTTRPSR